MDFPGLWKHFTVPAGAVTEDVFEDGIGFDGSSLRGWMPINESDMLLVPQPDTLFIDPFAKDVTLAMLCNIQDPLTKEDYSKDPRNVARKAVNYMKSTGTADAAMVGPSLEFFVFDDVRFDQTTHSAFYALDDKRGSRVEHRPPREAEPGLQGALPAGLLPVPADRRDARPAQRDDAGDGGVWADGREPPPPEGDGRAVGHQRALRRPGERGRRGAEVQVRRQERGPEARQDGDVHAEAAVRRLRQRHARPRQPVEERHQPVRRQRLLEPVRRGDVRPRGAVEARPGAGRDHQSDDEQLQAAGAGVRGAGEPGVQPAEPVRGRADPGLFGAGEVEAARIPGAGRARRTRTRLRRDADGDAGRHPQQDAPRPAARQGHL